MRAILSYLLLPISVFLLLFLSFFLFFYLKKKKAARYIFISAVSWFLLVSTSFVPNMLISTLENKYKPLLDISSFKKDSLIYIMVLGGGHTFNEELPSNNQLAGNALGRLVEGIRLHRLLSNSKLIVSGWAGSQPITQAEVMANTAILLGVDSADIYLLKKPTTTHEESKEYAKRFSNTQKLILITDAAHLPRAMKLFHKQGINPIPSPTNHIFKKRNTFRFIECLPSASNISKFEYATHEYIGMLWSYIEN